VTLIFADTSFYVAFLSPRDAHHADAVNFTINSNATVLTTEFVIVELANIFSRVAGRANVIRFIKSLRTDPDTIIIIASGDRVERGFDLFSRRQDKEWSLTDCISFVVMEEHGITETFAVTSLAAYCGRSVNRAVYPGVRHTQNQ
jgi:predicted nucleic acid-binding protein